MLSAISLARSMAPVIPFDPSVPANIDPTLVRMTVIVSWDSKDHGDQDYDWGAWDNECNFWRRHMVNTTFFLSRSRHW